jgi:hypothetical protein
MAVLSLDTLKFMLDILLTDTDYDEYLDFILSSAEKMVERELSIYLSSQDITVDVFGTDSAYLFLQYTPINSINSVKEYVYTDTVELSNDITDEVSIVDSLMGILLREQSNTIGVSAKFCKYNKYEINYNVGFSEVPEDLKYAIYQIAVKMYSLTDIQKSGVSKMTTPDGTLTYDFTLVPDSINSILDKYRKKI